VLWIFLLTTTSVICSSFIWWLTFYKICTIKINFFCKLKPWYVPLSTLRPSLVSFTSLLPKWSLLFISCFCLLRVSGLRLPSPLPVLLPPPIPRLSFEFPRLLLPPPRLLLFYLNLHCNYVDHLENYNRLLVHYDVVHL